MRRKSFISGAIILMLAGFVVRIFGFVYRIYLSNLIGAEGMGVFGLISPVYSLVILTLTSGISIAVSKMVAAENAKLHYINLIRITRCALGLVVTAAIAISLFMYFQIDFITNVLLKDSRTYYSLLLLIPCIPVIAAASAIKGYFYGTQDVVPTAISQIAEQLVKICLVMLTASYFVKLGLEYACALATVGMAAGEIANLLVVYIAYVIRKKTVAKKLSTVGLIRKRSLIREIIAISIPVSANRFIISILSAIEMVLIPRMLLSGGLDYHNSIALFGKLSGMAMPLLFFPSLVTSSLATTLVPAISEAISIKNFKSANYRISKSIQITFILGFMFTSIFMVYSNEISDLMYKKQNVGSILYMLSFTCIFMYLQQTLMGVLNGLGKQGILLRNYSIAATIRIAAVCLFIPKYGLTAYVVGLTVSMIINSLMNLYTVVKMTGMHIELRNWILKPGIVGLLMYLIGKYIYSFFTIFTSRAWLVILFTLLTNISVTLMLMIIARVLDIKDIKRLLGVK